MTDTNRTIRVFALLAAAGGAAWLVKLPVVAATDGGDSVTASILYLLGVALLGLGAATLTLRAARGRGRVAAGLAFVAAPFLFVLSYMLLDAVAKAVVGDAGPSWLEDEAGIGLTAAIWLALGLASRRSES